MNDNEIAYITLTSGVIVSFSIFMFSVLIKELGYGNWPVRLGALALVLSPLAMIFLLLLNYAYKKDKMWSALCSIILAIVSVSILTAQLLG